MTSRSHTDGSLEFHSPWGSEGSTSDVTGSQVELVQAMGTSASRQQASRAQNAEVVDQRFQEFARCRAEDMRRRFYSVLKTGVCLFFVGMNFLGAGILLYIFSPHIIAERWEDLGRLCGTVQITVGAMFASVGVLVMSTCPMSHLDIDSALNTRPRLKRLAYIATASGCLAWSVLPPHLGLFNTLLAVREALRCSDEGVPQPTTMFIIVCALTVFDVGCCYLFLYCNGCNGAIARVMVCWPGEMAHLWNGCSLILSCLAYPGAWAWVQLRGFRVLPTVAFYMAIYWLQFSIGATSVIFSFYLRKDPISQNTATIMFFAGISFCIPVCMVFCFGRNRIFKLVARRFERDWAELDGAIMVELLDSVAVEVGMTWWIHDGRDDRRFAQDDPRRNWQRGVVSKVTVEDFIVEYHREAPETLPRQRWSNPLDRRSSRSQLLSQSCSIDFPSSRSIVSTHRLPLAGRSMSFETLMRVFRGSLRCIEWQSMTPELMAKSKASGGGGETAAKLYNLSRAVGAAENIDYFMSHSWYDDPEQKFAKLQNVSEKFKRIHGRYPTFWLDKVCIDQTAIRDGLRMLPLSLMACREMLVLSGHTYATRLWCAWELCTLFAFSPLAENRVNFVPLHGEDDAGSLNSLESFDVCAARCYDPNEEARLMSVIEAVGVDAFNGRIRKMAASIRGTATSRLHLEQALVAGKGIVRGVLNLAPRVPAPDNVGMQLSRKMSSPEVGTCA